MAHKAQSASSSALSSASSSSAAGASSASTPFLVPLSSILCGAAPLEPQPVDTREWADSMAAPLVRNALRAYTGSWFSLSELLGEPRVTDENGAAAPLSAGPVTRGLVAHRSPEFFALFKASPSVSSLSHEGKIVSWNATVMAALTDLSSGSDRANTALHIDGLVCLQAARGQSMSDRAGAAAAAAAGPSSLPTDSSLTHWRVVPYAQGRCRCGVLSRGPAFWPWMLSDLRGSLIAVLPDRAQPREFISLSQILRVISERQTPVSQPGRERELSSMLQLRPFGLSPDAALSSSRHPFYHGSASAWTEALLHDVATHLQLRSNRVRLRFRWSSEVEPRRVFRLRVPSSERLLRLALSLLQSRNAALCRTSTSTRPQANASTDPRAR